MEKQTLAGPSTRSAILATALVTATPMCGAAPMTLTGKIGASRVVVEVPTDSKDSDGRYFYRKHHADIPLSVERNGADGLILKEVTSSGDVKARIALRRGTDATWNGTWTDQAGHAPLAVQLTALAPANGAGADAALSAYNVERLKDLPLTRGGTETVMGKSLRWWTEPVSQIRVFRIEGGYDAAVLNGLNARLAAEQSGAILGYFDCQLNVAQSSDSGDAGDYRFHAEPRLLAAALVSLRFETISQCSSHPIDVRTATMNVQIPTMRQLALPQVLFGDAAQPSAQAAKVPAWLANAMRKLHPADLAELKERCQFEDDAIWRDPQWSLKPAGVVLEPSFSSRDQGPCGGEWLLPWKMVALKPGPLPGPTR